jgi:hypothetical protein
VSKKILYPYQVLNTSVSSTTTYNSTATNVTFIDNISFVPLVASGTPSGTFAVQVSHDNVNYQALTLSAVPTITSGALSNVPVTLTGLPFPWVRLAYTNSSGTGTVTATIAGKQV